MTMMDRVQALFKLFSLPFSGRGGQARSDASVLFPSPGSQHHWELDAGDKWKNSIVMAAIRWQQNMFCSTPIVVRSKEELGSPAIISGHPSPALIRRPNPFQKMKDLWAGTLISYNVDGNAYWIKVRNRIAAGPGLVKELWWVPHWMMEPQWPESGKQFISHYNYRVNGEDFRIEKEDVIHFRQGSDPLNPRKGYAPVRSAVREIVTDNAAATYSAALMKNYGIPQAVISPIDASQTLQFTDPQEFLMRWRRKFADERNTEPFITPHAIKIDYPGMSPDDLSIETLRNLPEERICAEFGISPIVLGLGAGLEASTFSNTGEAREAAMEDCVMPMQLGLALDLDFGLLPELGNPDTEEVGWSYVNVRVLQEDADNLAKRCVELFESGLIMQSEGREKTGYVTGPEHDRFIFEIPELMKSKQSVNSSGNSGSDNKSLSVASMNGQ